MHIDDINLDYELGDARTLNVSIVVTDPDTGEKEGVTFDNLTTALYLIATSDVKIVEEYLEEFKINVGAMDDQLIRVPETDASEERIVTAGEVIKGWAESRGPLALCIECTGDPQIVKEWTATS